MTATDDRATGQQRRAWGHLTDDPIDPIELPGESVVGRAGPDAGSDGTVPTQAPPAIRRGRRRDRARRDAEPVVLGGVDELAALDDGWRGDADADQTPDLDDRAGPDDRADPNNRADPDAAHHAADLDDTGDEPDEEADDAPETASGRRAARRAARADRPPRRPGRTIRRWAGSARRGASDWLDRPMTSLHLVLAIFVLMLGFGLLMVLSSSAVSSFRTGGSSFSVFANQATYAVLGLICFGAAQYLPIGLLRSVSTAAIIVSLALLVAVLVPGIGALVNGARSWIRIGGLQFQPSEVAKLALLLWMAHVLAARRSTLGSPRALLIPVLPVFALMAGLIMMQPDLGTTVALTIVFMAVLFFAGAPWWIFGGLAAVGVAGFFAFAFSAQYRLARLLSFIDPESHPDVSYQLLQSLYGMGNGGWFGVGLGQSRAKWSYLPNADSDFIFAIIGEELGLIGAAILILLFGLLAYTGLRIARRNVDPFVKIVASAGTVWLVGQAAINIGYVVGLLPVTGIPLPMISAGGTSLLITMVVFGLLANFARREPQAVAALAAGGGSTLTRFLGLRTVQRPPRQRRRRRGSAALVAGETEPPAKRRRLFGGSRAPSTRQPQPAPPARRPQRAQQPPTQRTRTAPPPGDRPPRGRAPTPAADARRRDATDPRPRPGGPDPTDPRARAGGRGHGVPDRRARPPRRGGA